MLDLQKNRSVIIYGAAAVSLAILGTGITYYIIEDDKRAKRRKEARKAEKATIRILQQIKEQKEKIENSMKDTEDSIEDKLCTDKEFKRKEYTLAHSNELLLQLMEKLDAIRPLTIILGENTEPTEFENQLVSNIKSKKRNIIESIEGLFHRLDIANIKAKKESERREEIAKENERIEKEKKKLEEEEAERKAKLEAEQEKIRLEQEEEAKKEAERIAKEEAERRLEEDRLSQEAIEIERIIEEEDNVTVEEEAILVALKQVEQQEEK